MARYSGVSGASWYSPQPLVWSNEAWPASPRTANRSHWPFRLGYFVSSYACAPPSEVSSIAAIATARIELRRPIGYAPFDVFLGETKSRRAAHHLLPQSPIHVEGLERCPLAGRAPAPVPCA